MSITTGFAPRTHTSPVSIRGVTVAVLSRVGPALRRWYRAASTRRDLLDMDDRMLSDLGISRAQAQFEMQRMPWDK